MLYRKRESEGREERHLSRQQRNVCLTVSVSTRPQQPSQYPRQRFGNEIIPRPGNFSTIQKHAHRVNTKKPERNLYSLGLIKQLNYLPAKLGSFKKIPVYERTGIGVKRFPLCKNSTLFEDFLFFKLNTLILHT